MIVLFAALDLTNFLQLTANPIAIWFHNSGNAMIGYGTSITGIILFFKTTPLLLLLQNDYLKNGKYFRGFVVCIAMILSGTRANMLVSVFLIFAHFIFAEKNKNAKRIFCIIAVVVVLLVARRVFALVKELFDAKSGGDDVRSGHLRGILAFWKQNPTSLFFWGWIFVRILFVWHEFIFVKCRIVLLESMQTSRLDNVYYSYGDVFISFSSIIEI